jgi:hypothetical protein
MALVVVLKNKEKKHIDEEAARILIGNLFYEKFIKAKHRYGDFNVSNFELDFEDRPNNRVFGYSSIEKNGGIGVIVPASFQLKDLETTIGHELGHRILISNDSRFTNTPFSHAIAEGIALDLLGENKLGVVKGLLNYALDVYNSLSSRIAAFAVSVYLITSRKDVDEAIKSLVRS